MQYFAHTNTKATCPQIEDGQDCVYDKAAAAQNSRLGLLRWRRWGASRLSKMQSPTSQIKWNAPLAHVDKQLKTQCYARLLSSRLFAFISL